MSEQSDLSTAARAAVPLRLFHSAFSWRTLIRMSCGVLIAWLVFATMITALQRRLVFVGYRSGAKTAMPLPADSEGRVFPVEVPDEGANDAGFIRGWLCFAAEAESVSAGVSAGRPLVLYFGGNASNRGRRMRSVELFNRLGCDVLIVDYRGFADNQGSPSEAALFEDAQAVWDFATGGLGVDASRAVICGESLGGAVASNLAADVCRGGTRPAGLILRATFASLVETAAYHYPFVPVRVLLVDRFRTIDVVADISCPILQFHGVKDQIVPFRHGRELFKAAPEQSAGGVPKEWVTLRNAGHNNILWVDGDVVAAECGEFLRRVLK